MSPVRRRIIVPLALFSAIRLGACGTAVHSAGRPGSADSTRTRRDCQQAPWSPAQDLRADHDHPLFAEHPSAAMMPNGRLLLLGSPTVIWPSRDVAAVEHLSIPALDSMYLAGLTIDPSGRVTALAGDRAHIRMWSPRISVDSSDGSWALDVVYGGRGSDRASLADAVVELWYTRYRDGRWSLPERIYSDTVMWGHSVPPLVRRGDTLEAVVPTKLGLGNAPGVPILLLRRVHGTWTTHRLPLTGVYTALAPVPGGLISAYVTARRNVRVDYNSLFAAYSTGSDTAWSTGQLIHSSSEGNVEDPSLLARGDSLWLVWIQSMQPDLQAATESATSASIVHDSIGMAVSVDRGRTWRHAPSIAVDGRALGLFALEHDGAIHLTYRTIAEGVGRQAYAMWHDGQWQRLESVAGPEPASRAVLAIVRDSLWVAWGYGVPIHGGEVPILTIARRSLACDAATSRTHGVSR